MEVVVMTRGARSVRAKLSLASGATPLLAVMVRVYVVVSVVTGGVPDSTPSEKVTPVGRAPSSVMVGVGLPVAVTVNVLDVPSSKDVSRGAFGLKAGASSMVSGRLA